MADELRRAYHDRLADVRERTIELVRDAAASVGNVTAALLDRDRTAGQLALATSGDAAARLAGVENEVLELLALQAPVARDLRVILASLRIAQVAELCLGLSRSLGERVGQAEDVMTDDLRRLSAEIGAGTAELLEQANGAWIVFDEDLAGQVMAGAERCRGLQRQFLAALLDLTHPPVEAAVDLGLAARVYARLTDHAVEIADRVVFAVSGPRAVDPSAVSPS
jgi:phosphate transport system protein